MKIYTRREKIRHLKRQRFLTIPHRAAERLEAVGRFTFKGTTFTPLQYKTIYGGNYFISWSKAVSLNKYYRHRLINWKNLYLIPCFPTIQ